MRSTPSPHRHYPSPKRSFLFLPHSPSSLALRFPTLSFSPLPALSRGKAIRLFDSSPIIKRHDAYTLETADGVTVRIEGFINRQRTLDNGFPLEACNTFLFGFPTTWTDFADCPSTGKSSPAKILVNSPDNVPSDWPVGSEKMNPRDVHPTNTSDSDSVTRLKQVLCKFAAWVSAFNTVHTHSVDNDSHHLPEKSISDKDRLQDDDNCGTNMGDACTNHQVQDDDHNVDNDHEYIETSGTPDKDSKNHDAGFADPHYKRTGSLTGDLNVDVLPQENSFNHEKLKFIHDASLDFYKTYSMHSSTKGHNDECVGTRNTGALSDALVEKDRDNEEISRKEDEKADEFSIGKSEKARSGNLRSSLSKESRIENVSRDDQKHSKFSVKPVRRSPRLLLLKAESVSGEFQDHSQILNAPNDMNCANLTTDGSDTYLISFAVCTSAKDPSSSSLNLPNLDKNTYEMPESLSKPVRRSERLMPKKCGDVCGEFHDYSQIANEANNMNRAKMPSDGSKAYERCKPDCTISNGSPSSSTFSIPLPSAAVLSKGNEDDHQHSINKSLGVAPSLASMHGRCYGSSSSACLEGTPANFNVPSSQTVERRMTMCSEMKKDKQKARSKMKAEQNESINQFFGTCFEAKIIVSPAFNSRRKPGLLTTKSDKSLRTNSKVAKSAEISIERRKAEYNTCPSIERRTVWISSYTDAFRTPLTRYKQHKLCILTPESLNLKRSRSGRLIVPKLDSTMRILYESDGSIAGTASVDGSSCGTASELMSPSQCKGSGSTFGRKKGRKQL